jgi:hypothetical protein
MDGATRARAVVIALALAAALPAVHDAGACSCMAPRGAIVAPDRLDDAPLNTKVRLLVPKDKGAPPVRATLRVHATGDEVPTKTRSTRVGWVTLVELTPAAPLAPSTRYEVAVVDDSIHPSVRVVGTFATGTAADTMAPRIDKLGAAEARVPGRHRTSCSVSGPWIEIDDVAASDPGRPNAQLAWAVWRGNAAGVIDTSKPPETLVDATRGVLTIGRAHSCDWHDFALPAGVVWLGVAAIDEAGNTSPVRKVRVDMAKASPRTP